MLPLILDASKGKIVVVGNGPATEHRLVFLKEAGAMVTHYNTPPEASAYEGALAVFVADFDDRESATIAETVRSKKILLNIEDKTEFCDFHVPARVRRGDLLLTISTGGKSPRVARRIRYALETLFPERWKEKLNQLAEERDTWKEEGASFTELASRTDAWLDHEQLLSVNCACMQRAEQEAA